MHNHRRAKRHFALLDFQTAEMARVQQVAEMLIEEYRSPRAALVHSGRSYHLYMGVLLTHASWVKFMGRILLLNARVNHQRLIPVGLVIG